jgi:hypothetical protein
LKGQKEQAAEFLAYLQGKAPAVQSLQTGELGLAVITDLFEPDPWALHSFPGGEADHALTILLRRFGKFGKLVGKMHPSSILSLMAKK